jgi:ABC-type taurine transport system substrate-binding protein
VGLVSTYARENDTVRHGIQIGALGALRTVLPSVEKKYGLKYDIKDFRDSTSALLALDQGELDIANTTSQHLVRAISEGIDVVWIAGWGGGYNVLVARKGFDAPLSDQAALKAAITGILGSVTTMALGLAVALPHHRDRERRVGPAQHRRHVHTRKGAASQSHRGRHGQRHLRKYRRAADPYLG